MDYDLLNLLDEDDEDNRLSEISSLLSQFLKAYFDSRSNSSIAEFEQALMGFQESLGIDFDTSDITNEFVNKGLLTR